MFPDVDFHWFPLENPGLISIPLGFLLGWLGTLLSKEEPDTGKYAELEVRSLTGHRSALEPPPPSGRAAAVACYDGPRRVLVRSGRLAVSGVT